MKRLTFSEKRGCMNVNCVQWCLVVTAPCVHMLPPSEARGLEAVEYNQFLYL